MKFFWIFFFLLFPREAMTSGWRDEIRDNCKKVSLGISSGGVQSSWVKYNSPRLSDKKESFYAEMPGDRIQQIEQASAPDQWPAMPEDFSEWLKAVEPLTYHADNSWTPLIRENSRSLCIAYSLKVKFIPNCEKAFESIISFLNFQRIHNTVVNITIDLLLDTQRIKQIMFDTRNFSPILNASQSMLSSIRALESKSEKTPDFTFFTLLIDSFKKSGFTEAEARQRTWDFMAFYGSRGSAITYIMPYGFTYKGFNDLYYYALLALFSGTTYLDGLIGDRTGDTGGINFTLPKSIKGDCHSGKPYHFWMTASMTKHLLDNGFSKVTAYHAVYLFSIAHELGARSYGRNPDLIVSSALDSNYNSAVRIQLVMKALGSLFAIDEKKNYDMDLAIHLMRKQMKPPLAFFKLKDINRECKDQYLPALCILKYQNDLFDAFINIIQPAAFNKALGVPK